MTDTELLHLINYTARYCRYKFQSDLSNNENIPEDAGIQTGKILHLLIKKGDLTQKQLSEIMDIRPQSLTLILDKMELSQYITRTRDNKDKRIQTVHITDKGKELGGKIHKIRKQSAGDLFADLSEEEKDTLVYLLNKVTGGKE